MRNGDKGNNISKEVKAMVEGKGTGTGNTYELDMKDFVRSFIGVVKTVILKPKEFYQNMPTTGGFPSPLIFLVVCLGISALISAIIWGTVAGFFYFLIFGLVVSFIGAAILYFIAQQFFEGKGTYEGTYRVVAYAGVVSLISWLSVIPVLGGIIAFLAFLYGFYLQFVGVEKVHKITQGQAIVTVLIAFAVSIILGLLMPGGLFLGMR
jgi:hypothetical protein